LTRAACFQKKAQKTSKADFDLAAKRYPELARELGDERRTLCQLVGCDRRCAGCGEEPEAPFGADDRAQGADRASGLDPLVNKR
jgi:hypothetical protein